MDIITDFLLVNQYMTVFHHMEQVKNISDPGVMNLSRLFRPRTCYLNNLQLLDEGSMEFYCQEFQYIYGIMTLGFIYLPAVPTIGALFGHSIAGILGIPWSIIMIVSGICIDLTIDPILIPKLVAFYFIVFGVLLLWMSIYQGSFQPQK